MAAFVTVIGTYFLPKIFENSKSNMKKWNNVLRKNKVIQECNFEYEKIRKESTKLYPEIYLLFSFGFFILFFLNMVLSLFVSNEFNNLIQFIYDLIGFGFESNTDFFTLFFVSFIFIEMTPFLYLSKYEFNIDKKELKNNLFSKGVDTSVDELIKSYKSIKKRVFISTIMVFCSIFQIVFILFSILITEFEDANDKIFLIFLVCTLLLLCFLMLSSSIKSMEIYDGLVRSYSNQKYSSNFPNLSIILANNIEVHGKIDNIFEKKVLTINENEQKISVLWDSISVIKEN